jgi:hypothetical protein
MKLTVAHKHTLDPDCKGERQSTARLSVVPFSRPFPEQVFLHDHMTVCVMPKVVTAQRILVLHSSWRSSLFDTSCFRKLRLRADTGSNARMYLPEIATAAKGDSILSRE